MYNQSNLRRITIDDKSIVIDFASCDQFEMEGKTPNGPCMFEDISTDKILDVKVSPSGTTGASCTNNPLSSSLGCVLCVSSKFGVCQEYCKMGLNAQGIKECKTCKMQANGTCL